jgi:hypothetical protein
LGKLVRDFSPPLLRFVSLKPNLQKTAIGKTNGGFLLSKVQTHEFGLHKKRKSWIKTHTPA